MPHFGLHHVGCAVPSLEDALRPYRHALGFSKISQFIDIHSQGVRVCFVETAPRVFVELVQGLSAESPVSSFLKRRQYYYHVCYSTADVMESVEHLEQHGFRRLSVFASEAFNGSECAFMLTPEMALLELCLDGAFSLL